MNFKEYSHIKDMPLLNDKTILKPGVLAETYIKKLHAAEEENKRLRAALERISIGMDIRPFNATASSVEGYFRGIAEATLKGE